MTVDLRDRIGATLFAEYTHALAEARRHTRAALTAQNPVEARRALADAHAELHRADTRLAAHADTRLAAHADTRLAAHAAPPA